MPSRTSLEKKDLHRHSPHYHDGSRDPPSWTSVPQGQHNPGSGWEAAPPLDTPEYTQRGQHHTSTPPWLTAQNSWRSQIQVRVCFSSRPTAWSPLRAQPGLSHRSYPSLTGCLTHSTYSVIIWMNEMEISTGLGHPTGLAMYPWTRISLVPLKTLSQISLNYRKGKTNFITQSIPPVFPMNSDLQQFIM